ncbi:MAG: hypothetical protein KGI56_05890 [Acidobacteriota bacterium]|nr:hypothetical protein [Acidobacteriota bacterium]
MRMRLPLAAFLALATALAGQSLSDRLREVRIPWEAQIDRGDAPTVRKGIEALLGREGVSVNPSDYNDMHALVALQGLAARACVSEGSWEDAVAHLQKAQAAAAENLTNATALLAKTRAEHEAKLKEFQDSLATQQLRLKALDDAPGLTQDQIKLHQQLKIFVQEQQAAIAHSQKSLADIASILATLQQDQASTTQALSAWQAFLAQEKTDIAQAGGPARYVAEKLIQVKGDDSRPQAERLAYARRLEKLDPGNAEVSHFVRYLLGQEATPSPMPRPMVQRSKRKHIVKRH